jgi:predicted ATPase/DNA-binding SARP family transcriptional activator
MILTKPQPDFAPLTISLFGPPQIYVGGDPFPHLRSRKVLWLLALLALRHGRPVEREWLAGTLWPDANQDQMFASLRPVLTWLRQALGKEGTRLYSPDRHSLCLDLEGAEVDVLAFDAAIARKTLPDLERAVSLYRGPLLEGCAEEWVGQERNAREQDCMDALLALAEHALTTGDLVVAVGYYRRVVGLDPWLDTAQRGLMEALAQNGDANAALCVYREFVKLLRSDPKAAPDVQTAALYARIRAEARRQSEPSAFSIVADSTRPKVAGNLPLPLSRFIGREEEQKVVADRLRRSRLVTLTGQGGIGKTSLALEVASELVEEFIDGVWLVALESLTDGRQLAGQVAAAMELREETDRGVLQNVIHSLRTQRALLVLDNCEHLLEDCARFAGDLLRECGGIRILATSREALRITGERVCAVPPLTAPDPAHLTVPRADRLQVLAGYEAVQLFVERARTARSGFAWNEDSASAVAEICIRLEGIPLAIKLAAARTSALTVGQIAARLGDYLGMLTGGSRTAPQRQQTLRATLDWSYSLLQERERILLNRLSVFVGGWTLEAAETVCSGEGIEKGTVLDLITALVGKSLVLFEATSDGRYRLLETVRQYSAERLEECGRVQHVRAKHHDWILALTEEGERQLQGPNQALWIQRLKAERENVRGALEWAGQGAPDSEATLRLATAMWPFWKADGMWSEARQHLQRALGREGAQTSGAARARALNAAGNLAELLGDTTGARALYEEALGIQRWLDDKPGSAVTLRNLGAVAHTLGDYPAAQDFFEQSLKLYRQFPEPRGYALTLGNLGNVLRQQGEYAASVALYEEARTIYRTSGDLRNMALTLNNLGNMKLLQGEYTAAYAYYDEALRIRRGLDDKPGIAWSLSGLGRLAITQGDIVLARSLLEESLQIRRELGAKSSIAWTLHNLSHIAAQHDHNYATARALLEESLDLFAEMGEELGRAWSLGSLGHVAFHLGDNVRARELHTQSLMIFRTLGDREGLARGLVSVALVLAALGETKPAVRVLSVSTALREQIGATLMRDEQDDVDRQISELHTILGEAAFIAVWEESKALPWEQALSDVFGEAHVRT